MNEELDSYRAINDFKTTASEARRARIVIWIMGTLFAVTLIAAFVLSAKPARAHSWFTGATDPVTGLGCCDGRDCKEIPDTDVRAVDGGYIYIPRNEFIPRASVQSSKSFGFARCEFLYSYGAEHPKGSTRCFFEPSGF